MKLQRIISLRNFLILILIALIVSTFRDLPKTFYQQDEWLGSGQVLALGYGVVLKDLSWIQVIFSEGRPLARLLGAFFFKTFEFNTVPLAIYSVFFHSLNTILVFLITFKVIKKYLASFIASSFFAFNSIASQAVTWFGASFGIQPAVFLVLLSIYLYLIYLSNQKRTFMYLSILSAIVSLYFKEIGIFLVVFLPFLSLIYKKKFSVVAEVKNFLPIIIFFSLLALYRLFDMIFIGGGPTGAKVFLSSSTSNIYIVLISRIILYPLTSFSLIFIPYDVAKSLAIMLLSTYYPYIQTYISRWDLIAYTVIIDVFAIILSFILIEFLTLIFLKRKDLRKVIEFAVVFFLLTLVPYVVVAKDYAYLEPRYYYLSSVASGIILAIFVESIINFLGNKKVIAAALLVVFLFYIRFQIKIIRTDIANQVVITNERMAFLKTLKNDLPTLKSDTNVFYFTGNKSWLVDGNMTPFQHGFGYSVMAIYYKSGKIPPLLPSGQFLFNLGEEGFKTDGNLRFGYYNNFGHLLNAVQKYKVNSRDVHAFYYNRDQKKLYDITNEIRTKLITQ